MTFGERVKELRHERGLTQRELARRVGVDYTYLSKMENNRLEHTPSINTLQDLARELEADELELMDLADKVPAALQSVVRDRAALQFFRRASETLKRPEDWQEMLAYLERREARE